MAAIKYAEFEFVFDDVQFAIDVWAARHKLKMSQDELAERVGFSSGSAISGIETGKPGEGLSMRRFMAIVRFCDLHPFDYFDMQRVE